MKKRKITNALAAFFAAMLVALVAMVLVSCENEPLHGGNDACSHTHSEW